MVLASEIMRFRQHELELVTPARAIKAIKRMIMMFEFVARSEFVALEKMDIASAVRIAIEMVIIYLSNMYAFAFWSVNFV